MSEIRNESVFPMGRDLGLTVRDFYAGMALIGLLVTPQKDTEFEYIPYLAYEIADRIMVKRAENE